MEPPWSNMRLMARLLDHQGGTHLRAAMATAAAAVLALASCTYGEPKRALELEHAVADDGSKLAIAAERYVWQRPTGIAAFPTGGLIKVTDQAVDVYVVDLASKKILYRHAIDTPGRGSMHSFSAWVLGWQGNDVYVKMHGCLPGFWTSYKGCYGEREQGFVYRVSRDGVEPAGEPVPPLRRHRYLGGATGRDARPNERAYFSLGDGVWIHHGSRGPREQLLRVNGQDLEEVLD